MGFSSALYPGEKVVSNPNQLQARHAGDGETRGRGLSQAQGYAGSTQLQLFPANLLVPQSEWQARIQEQEERKSRLSDLILMEKLPPKDQGQTSQCWINAGCHCIEINRMQQNQETVILSPSSVGGPLKNWSDPGGYGKEGLDGISLMGLCPVDLWPANAIQSKYNTAANRTKALLYRNISGWNFPDCLQTEMVSASLIGFALAGGYNNISHEITMIEPVWLDGALAWRIRNSWGRGYGYEGFAIFTDQELQPDDCCAPTVEIAS